MGLLTDIFDIDPQTEKDIKNVLKVVGFIATVVIAGGAADDISVLPFNNNENEGEE